MSGPRFARGNDSVEFDRVLYFSDAVFAIAMTLLVVQIGVPAVSGDELGEALRDKSQEILSFFITFVVIGYYWLAHHRMFSQLRGVDSRLMMINLVYLATIAFMPFPSALVGQYEDEPITVIIYAVTLGVASALEAAMFVHARRRDLLKMQVPDDVAHHALRASLVPVVVFAISIPIALFNPTLALLSWLLIFVGERVVDRWKPPGADELFR